MCRCSGAGAGAGGGEGRNVSDKEAVSVALAEKGLNFVLSVVAVRVIQSHPTTGLTLMKSIRVQGYILRSNDGNTQRVRVPVN